MKLRGIVHGIQREMRQVNIMKYESLSKIYYVSPDNYMKEYTSRFMFPYSMHLGIRIRQYNRKHDFEAFFYYPNEIAILLEKIHKSYEEFLAVESQVPPVVLHQFSLLSILDEVKSTNDIEGVRSTRKEIREIIDGVQPRSGRLESIVNKYISLMTDTEIDFNTCQDIRNFFDDFTHKEISKENPNRQLDGEIFRKDPVDIASAAGKTIHQGLFPESVIISTMNEALKILHREDILVLVRLGLFHYFFAYIHPFYDGNGRTDRFITSYFLGKFFQTIPALRLSVYIQKNKKKYYDLFSEADSEINRGDLTPFIIGFLEIIHGTVLDTIGLLRRKNDQLNKYKNQIEKLGLEDELLSGMYYILLQAALFYGQGVSISDLMQITGKSRGTMQKRMEKIPEEHMLITKVGKVNYYKLNLKLFSSNRS